jgi:hypothetical protein
VIAGYPASSVTASATSNPTVGQPILMDEFRAFTAVPSGECPAEGSFEFHHYPVRTHRTTTTLS